MIIDYTIRLMRTFFVVLILLKVFAALCCGQDLLISLIKRRLSGRACVTRKPKEALGCASFVSQLEYLLSLSDLEAVYFDRFFLGLLGSTTS